MSKPFFFNTSIEEAVIGTSILDNSVIPYFIGNGLDESWFCSTKTQVIWRAIRHLHDADTAIDVVSVCLEIESMGCVDKIGGLHNVAQIAGEIATSALYREYFAKLAEHVKLRRLYNLSSKMQQLMGSNPVTSEEVLSLLEGEKENIEEIHHREPLTIAAIYHRVINKITDFRGVEKYNIGLKDVDGLTGGIFPEDFTVIAGESSIGKTSFLMAVLRHINTVYKVPVMLFSLEMGYDIIGMRDLSLVSNVCLQNIRRGNVNIDHIMTMMEKYAADTFYIDTEAWSITEIEARCSYMARTAGVRVFAIDYIQLVDANLPRSASREQQVSHVAKIHKKIAKETNAHVIGASQLDENWRWNGKRTARPTGRNVRESKAIKHHCDNLLILYRNPDKPSHMFIAVDKARNDITGTVEVGWKGETLRFYNLNESEKTPPKTERRQHATREDPIPF